MKTKLNELRLDAGIARVENYQWLCVLDKETGMMIDPMIGLNKFAELIVQECAQVADTERPSSLGCGYITKTTGMRIKEHFGVD